MVSRTVIQLAGRHAADGRFNAFLTLLLQVFHISGVFAVIGLTAEKHLNGVDERHFKNVAVHAEGIDGAVLMKHGNGDAVDVLFLCKLGYALSDFTDIGKRKSVSVNGNKHTDASAARIGNGGGSDFKVVLDGGGKLFTQAD